MNQRNDLERAAVPLSLGIVDYGMGNLGSVVNMLRSLECPLLVSHDFDQLASCDALLLPGVGHFGQAMSNLENLDLVGPLTELVLEQKKPVLGICLGMQLLGDHSEEGDVQGLGWIPGSAVRLPQDAAGQPKVPHMGWNYIDPVRADDLVPPGTDQDEVRYYFAHSYHFCPTETSDELARCHYGIDFVAAVGRGNVRGVQFHPEKSHRFGKLVLARYLALCRELGLGA